MFQKIVFLFLLILISSEINHLVAQSSSSNPIMVIRCRFEDRSTEEAFKKDVAKVDDPCPETSDFEPITIPDGNGACVPICFDGAMDLSFPNINCDRVNGNGLVITNVCFTSADPINNPMIVGQFVAIDDISNCLDDSGNEWLPEFLANATYDPTYDEAGFGPAMNVSGTIQVCATFYVDPATLVTANVISDTTPNGRAVNAAPCPELFIPTMGQWGLLILGMMLSCMAMAFMVVARGRLS